MATLPETTQRISLWSNRLRVALGVVLVAVPLLTAASLLANRSFGGVLRLGDMPGVDLSTMPAVAALLTSLGALADLMLRLLPLLFLRRLLAFWACGSLLTQASAHALQLTGIAIALGALGGIAIVPLTGLLVLAATGTEALPLSIELDLASLIAGGVIYLVGMVMREAARLAEEAALTI
jgi:hypothetical protein